MNAKRHGVEVWPIDIARSDWDCTLEQTDAGGYAVRIGLRYIKGLSKNDYRRICSARTEAAFVSVFDFVMRAKIDKRIQTRLTESGALSGFGHGRPRCLVASSWFSGVAR